MMTQASLETPLWNRIYMLAEAMEDQSSSIEHIESFLHGLEEGFGDVFDPAEDFPEFVAVRLCSSMAQLLSRLEDPQSRSTINKHIQGACNTPIK
jgi:hypothetical protein